MKKLKIFLLSLVIVAFGCAGTRPVDTPVPAPPQEVDIMVTIDESGCTFIEPEVNDRLLDKEHQGLPKVSQLSWIMNNEGYIKIFSGLSVADVTRTWNDLVIFEWLELDKVTVFINSPGGDAFSGIALANFILKFRDRGMIINMEASGIVASAAVPIFAAGTHREALPGTIFMVHEAALWKWPGRETASDIRSQNELMTILRNEYLGILADHTTTPFSEWEEMEGRTTWFNVETAKDLGLID